MICMRYPLPLLAPLVGIVSFGLSRVYAQPTWKTLSLKGIIDLGIEAIAGVFIPLAVTILFLVFVWGVVVYMHAASKGDNSMADLAKKRLLYAVIILFAVFSLWGFVYMLRRVFSGDRTVMQDVQQVRVVRSVQGVS